MKEVFMFKSDNIRDGSRVKTLDAVLPAPEHSPDMPILERTVLMNRETGSAFVPMSLLPSDLEIIIPLEDDKIPALQKPGGPLCISLKWLISFYEQNQDEEVLMPLLDLKDTMDKCFVNYTNLKTAENLK